MIYWLIGLVLLSPIRQVENVRFRFSSPPADIFQDYETHNFKQRIFLWEGKIYSEVHSVDFQDLDLNFRIFRHEDRIRKLPVLVRNLLEDLPLQTMTLREFIHHVARLMKENIHYSEEDLPQDPTTVLFNGKASCVGYSALFSVLLGAVGIENKFVRGFYLKKNGEKSWIPVPHRWVEVTLANGRRYFYDPQHHTFSSHYVVVKDDIDFTKVKKFRVHLVRKSKVMSNN